MDLLVDKAKSKDKNQTLIPRTIRIHVPLDEPNVICNFTELAETKYGWDALHPLAARLRAQNSKYSDDDDSDSDQQQTQVVQAHESGTAPPAKKKRRANYEDYDIADPFIDDDELEFLETTAASKDGFFVYSGPLVPEGEKPKIERLDGSTKRNGKGSRGGRASRTGGRAAKLGARTNSKLSTSVTAQEIAEHQEKTSVPESPVVAKSPTLKTKKSASTAASTSVVGSEAVIASDTAAPEEVSSTKKAVATRKRTGSKAKPAKDEGSEVTSTSTATKKSSITVPANPLATPVRPSLTNASQSRVQSPVDRDDIKLNTSAQIPSKTPASAMEGVLQTPTALSTMKADDSPATSSTAGTNTANQTAVEASPLPPDTPQLSVNGTPIPQKRKRRPMTDEERKIANEKRAATMARKREEKEREKAVQDSAAASSTPRETKTATSLGADTSIVTNAHAITNAPAPANHPKSESIEAYAKKVETPKTLDLLQSVSTQADPALSAVSSPAIHVSMSREQSSAASQLSESAKANTPDPKSALKTVQTADDTPSQVVESVHQSQMPQSNERAQRSAVSPLLTQVNDVETTPASAPNSQVQSQAQFPSMSYSPGPPRLTTSASLFSSHLHNTNGNSNQQSANSSTGSPGGRIPTKNYLGGPPFALNVPTLNHTPTQPATYLSQHPLYEQQPLDRLQSGHHLFTPQKHMQPQPQSEPLPVPYNPLLQLQSNRNSFPHQNTNRRNTTSPSMKVDHIMNSKNS